MPKSLVFSAEISSPSKYKWETILLIQTSDGNASSKPNPYNNMQSATLGSGLITIGTNSFKDCDMLEEVYILDARLYITNKLFYECGNLKNIDLGLYVTGIGNNAFNGCNNIVNIKIPNSVAYIGTSAFENCSSLKNLTINDAVTSIESSAFKNCTNLRDVSLGNNITEIRSSAFYGCNSLNNIVVPKSVTLIESYAFYGCNNLAEITLPFVGKSRDKTVLGSTAVLGYIFGETSSYVEGVTTTQMFNDRYGTYYYIPHSLTKVTITDEDVITMGAFSNCANLDTIIIPNNTTRIRKRAFENCTSLKNFTLPPSVTVIEEKAFSSSLENLYISDLTSWCNIEFEDTDYTAPCGNPLSYAENLYIGDELQKELVIPDTVNEIKAYAFYNFIGLEYISLPYTITNIGYRSFAGCNSIKNVYYDGDINDWEKIIISAGNESLLNANFNYSDSVRVFLTYDANSGENAPAQQHVSENSMVKLTIGIPTREYYKFLGWAKSPDATKPEYKSGDNITIGTENIILYAVWQRTVVTNTSIINNVIMVTPTNAQVSDCIIIAYYMDGRMVHIDTYSYNGETTIPFIPNDEYDTIKIMVWESLSNLKPLSDVEEL